MKKLSGKSSTKFSSEEYMNLETERERTYDRLVASELEKTNGRLVAEAPMLYLDRRLVTLILTRMKMFEAVLDVQGSVVECGVHRANSLMTYYHMSSIFEPVAFNRKIIGFDTFTGFPSVSDNDNSQVRVGRGSDTDLEHIKRWIKVQDTNRSIGHVPKIELIQGDACQTIPDYLKKNPHLIISLLYLDFDLYEPTLVALKHLAPLVPKGGLIGFDELNQAKWRGETMALKAAEEISGLRLKKFPFDAHVSYYQVE
jgi:hypothetical protein